MEKLWSTNHRTESANKQPIRGRLEQVCSNLIITRQIDIYVTITIIIIYFICLMRLEQDTGTWQTDRQQLHNIWFEHIELLSTANKETGECHEVGKWRVGYNEV